MEEDHAERVLGGTWEFSDWIEEDTLLKAELAIGHARLLAALEYFECISTAAVA
jgi:hypothetical protein